MMALKTKLVLLLATLSILMTQIDVIYGIDVDMNDNFTATVGEVGEINCSFSKENLETIFTVGLHIRNKTTNTFVPIVTFRPGISVVFTPSGEYLRHRVTVTNITQESTEATLIFNQLSCIDQTQYLCVVAYLNTDNAFDSDRSLPTTINVTVLPQKPNISRSLETTSKGNHNVEKRSISRNEHFTHTSVTLKTREHDEEFSSTKSTITVDEGEQFPREGDNVSFVCSGNVGRPPGVMLWQKVYAHENISFSYVNKTTTVEKIPGKCSFNGISNLTFQLSAADFKARVRCSVVSQDGIDKMYIETDPLDLYFRVRHVSIIKLPNKDNFDPSIKNITLTCNSDGNPEPRFTWYEGQNTSNILSRSNKYVIKNVIKNNSGTYICEVYNFISGEQFNASSSVDITIENLNDSSEDKNNSSENTNLLIGIGTAGGFLIFALIIIASAICRHRAKSKRLPESKDKATSESLIKNGAKDNPCYTLDSGTSIDETVKDSAHAMDTRNDKLENEGKRNGKPSTTESSKSTKETLNENTCDNSSDHYASSVPGVYDELNGNRYKTDKDETFDRMIELKSLPENRNKSHPINLENSRRGGYESVVIDGDTPVISSEKNAYGHDDPETIRQHNKEYIDYQKQEEKKMNKSPIPNQTVEYAEVNEATKLKYKTKSNDTDQTTVNVGVSAISKDMTPDITDHIDTQTKNTTSDETESLNKSRLRKRNNTQSFVNDGKAKEKVAIVSPFVGLSVKSEGDTQEENTNTEIQQEIEDVSGQTVDHAQNFETNNQKNQQTNGNPEPSLKYNQTEPHTNQTFDNDEYPQIDSVSMNDIQEEEQVNQNSEQHSINDYEKVQIEL